MDHEVMNARRSYARAGNDGLVPIGQMIKEALELEAEESIPDEMVERVLAPVLKMIREGRFDRPQPRKKNLVFFPQMAALAAVAALAVTVSLYNTSPAPQAAPSTVVIPDQRVPLAGPALFGNQASGSIMWEDGGGVAGIAVQLVRADTGSIEQTQVTDENGGFTFTGFADGEYSIRVLLTEGMASDDLTGDGLLTIDGQDAFTFGEDAPETMDDERITVWTTGQ